MKNQLPDTINLHFTPQCNARCKFCFAAYKDVKTPRSLNSLKKIINLIAKESSGSEPKRVNFVGGEPTIHKALPELLAHAKSHGLKTSIVTNGFVMLRHGIDTFVDCTDMIGLSIDSIDPRIIALSGRYHQPSGYIPTEQNWKTLAADIQHCGIDLKINTVVNRLNHTEDMCNFIEEMSPQQWKLFQVTPVVGQNDAHFSDWAISTTEFDRYCDRSSGLRKKGVRVVSESSEVMINSYAIIGPNGCFVDNADGKHSYSQPIEEVGVSKAWSQIRFDQNSFNTRRGNRDTAGKEVTHA